ncbi:MAG: multicopper oxidase family protein [Polyangiaceae bacterium]
MAPRALIYGTFLLTTIIACTEDSPGSVQDSGVASTDAGELMLQPSGWSDLIASPELEDLDPAPGVVRYNLEARVQETEVLKGAKSSLWTYNGIFSGPVIRAKKGDRLSLHFTNHLAEPTTIHWHGLKVPNNMDGAGAPVAPGQSFDYAFELKDAGTYWYHSHQNSSAQVGFGLYGALIVEDPEDPALGDSVPLVFSDLSAAADGTIAPGNQDGRFGDYFGREGAVLLVNGKYMPKLKGRVGVPQRWRVINAARARYLTFRVPNARVTQIGGDAGLIARPLPVDRVSLAPGERVELYVLPTVRGAGKQDVLWEDSDRLHTGSPRASVPFMTFETTDQAPPQRAVMPLPAALREIQPLPTAGSAERVLEMTETKGAQGTVLGFNGKAFSEAGPLMATVGDTEVWEIRNLTGQDHPFHLHGFSFQITERNGALSTNREWKDTINVPANTQLKLVLRWDDRPGMWMFHCHILDHVELGMMGMVDLMRR